jgi:hypothetical protein
LYVIFDVSSKLAISVVKDFLSNRDCAVYVTLPLAFFFFLGGSSESYLMGVSIMLTTIPRLPPGSGLFLQGKL